jgi:hypothetical protein
MQQSHICYLVIHFIHALPHVESYSIDTKLQGAVVMLNVCVQVNSWPLCSIINMTISVADFDQIICIDFAAFLCKERIL